MISITVHPETAGQMSILAKALIALLADADAPTEVVDTPKKPRKTVAAAEPAPEAQTPTEPVAEPAPTPAITLEEVRAKLSVLSQAGKQPEVKALIAKFGATKLTDLAADKYADLLTAAEAL